MWQSCPSGYVVKSSNLRGITGKCTPVHNLRFPTSIRPRTSPSQGVAQQTAISSPGPSPHVADQTVAGTPGATVLGPPPDYTELDAKPLNRLVTALFRKRMATALNEDEADESYGGYEGIIKLTRKLNAKYATPREVQEATVAILCSLMPSFLPALHRLVVVPLPWLACKMNAFATWITCQWLMGPSVVNDVETDTGKVEQGFGVKVERCRYLEQSGCVGICVNSCKVPTEEFFATKMGIPVTLTPNYEDFSCQFAFGKTPMDPAVDPAFQSPCFSQCPTKRRASMAEANRVATPSCHRI